MKIYISGAHAQGKTTLARYISEKYKIPLIPEAARLVLSERELQIDSLRANIDLVDSYQTDVFYRQIKEELKLDEFVSDRSLLDCVAYATQHSRVSSDLVNSNEYKNYIKKLHEKEAAVFFIRPSGVSLRNDGVREHLTWDGIVAIDAMIKCLLEINNIKYYQINSDSMQERIRFVDAVINKF